MTLDELRRIIPLGEGDVIEGIEVVGGTARPMLALTISGPLAPVCQPFEVPHQLAYDVYMADVRGVAEERRQVEDRERGYIPAREPAAEVSQREAARPDRPKFPGEDLDYTGREARDREDIRAGRLHTGGPR